jgi:hypothetical protein
MKKILIILAIIMPIKLFAQLNGKGFYRVQNYTSQRYITITDDVIGEIDMTTMEPDMTNITTIKGFDYVKSSPASIIYFEPIDSKWNMIAQGVDVYEVADKRSYITVTSRNDGSYVFSATASGLTLRLADSENSGDEGYVTTKYKKSQYTYWYISPVDTNDNYLGLQPTVNAPDGYYGTLYASFPFKVSSSDVNIYYVDGVKEGMFQLNEITDEVKPAMTPLVFKCSSNEPSNNKIIPVNVDTTTPENNALGGTLFDKKFPKHNAYIKYDNSNMRVLGLDEAGNLAFVTAKESDLTDGQYIPKNTCWLNTGGLSGNFKLVSRDDFTGIRSIESTKTSTAKATFTLSGVKVDDSKTLSPGIYIKNGKKVVIK